MLGMSHLKCFYVFLAILVVGNQQREICKTEKSEGRKWKVECENITTAIDVRNAVKFIRNNSHAEFIYMKSGNIAILPVDVFADTNISYIRFDSFQMKNNKLYDVINPVCATLKKLYIINSEIISGIIPSGKFKKCNHLEYLAVWNCGIKIISPYAFQGLHNLKGLYLNNNKVTSLAKRTFQGLNKLKYLYIDNNKLERLEEGLFKPFSKTIGVVYFFGNLLNCNCSLQWLQNWIKEQKSKKPNFIYNYANKAICKSPEEGDITALKFCNTTQLTPSANCKDDQALNKLTKLLTMLLNNANSSSPKKCPDESVISKLQSALEVKRTLLLFLTMDGIRNYD